MRTIVDYLVVVPLDEEFGYVIEILNNLSSSTANTIAIDTDLYERTTLRTSNGDVSVVVLTVGQMTEGPVWDAVKTGVKVWRPETVMLIGIAGSLDASDLQVGDVIVPSRVFGYTEFKSGKTLTYRPTGHNVSCQLTALARGVARKRESAWRQASKSAGLEDPALKGRIQELRDDAHPKLHMHPNDCLGSGNQVVASKRAARDIRKKVAPTIRAVEMEAKGAFEALHRIKEAPPMLIVRGISDYADEDKSKLETDFKGAWRRYAAQNAARFAAEFIEQRSTIARDYRPSMLPKFPMECHAEGARLCLEANLRARDAGMRILAFRPLMTCSNGIAETKLTIRSRDTDGHVVEFVDLVLRRIEDRAELLRCTGIPEPIELPRNQDPPGLELLVGMAKNARDLEVVAEDEFGRQTRGIWSPPR